MDKQGRNLDRTDGGNQPKGGVSSNDGGPDNQSKGGGSSDDGGPDNQSKGGGSSNDGGPDNQSKGGGSSDGGGGPHLQEEKELKESLQKLKKRMSVECFTCAEAFERVLYQQNSN
ncbi:uncharacterized protein LOC125899553 [Epinephelus fuscoguttatus]|uniref:uncharacterized protein LOC125899553 n=1 Tax=Epinephelus fuscoguttatus TaxID=293821 RepID=UPI0020D08F75|nr:uncharacterized protein LOC125899553 [Epinephelus fuscoguttatus]